MELVASSEPHRNVEQTFQEVWKAMFSVCYKKKDFCDLMEKHEVPQAKYLAGKANLDLTKSL